MNASGSYNPGSAESVGILLDADAQIPVQAYDYDVGYDIYAVEDYYIPAGTMAEIKTGLHIVLPQGMFAQVNTRSSYGKQGLFVHHGVIDPGFTGEITIFVFNSCILVDTKGFITKKDFEIKKGDKIAQLLFHKAEYPALTLIDELPDNTERGKKCLGSSDEVNNE